MFLSSQTVFLRGSNLDNLWKLPPFIQVWHQLGQGTLYNSIFISVSHLSHGLVHNSCSICLVALLACNSIRIQVCNTLPHKLVLLSASFFCCQSKQNTHMGPASRQTLFHNSTPVCLVRLATCIPRDIRNPHFVRDSRRSKCLLPPRLEFRLLNSQTPRSNHDSGFMV
jgi:hypothetical protein